MTAKCICGEKISNERAHSSHFLACLCASCGTIKFSPKAISINNKFSYDSSLKYNEKTALKAPSLRWGHYAILDYLIRTRGSAIEFGCHNGFFVANLIRHGVDAFGVDVNSNAINSGKVHLGLADRLFSVEDLPLDIPVDTGLFIDVLEHIDDPSQFLHKIISHYPGISRLIISGPTTSKIFNDKSDFPPHHLWRFSVKGIIKMLQANGFSEVEVRYERNPILLLRNIIGRILYGFNRREFYGDAPPFTGFSFLENRAILKFYSCLGYLFPFNYCSVIMIANRQR